MGRGSGDVWSRERDSRGDEEATGVGDSGACGGGAWADVTLRHRIVKCFFGSVGQPSDADLSCASVSEKAML